MSVLLSALAAFGAGTLATAMGAVNAFIMTGIIAIVGGMIQCSGIAESGALYSIVAFGTFFGPHMSFAAGAAAAGYARKIGKLDNGCNLGLGLASLGEPSVLAVGGVFGVIAWAIGTYVIPAIFGGIIPFGTDNGTGNKSWLDLPLMPVQIQPAEICKITYIIIMASVMNSHQNRISHPVSIIHMIFHLGLLVGLNMVLSKDAGVSLIFVFIFIGMAFAGGVNMGWFALAFGLIIVAIPVVWPYLGQHQQARIMILFDDSIDPQGINERYHTMMNLKSLTGGGLTGQGLFNGNRTQSGALFAQHTDYIFSSMGEEMGFFGCVLIMLMELAIIARCIYVGIKCQDYMRRLVCFGAASALIFQVMVNTGMCIGVMPVIGLTLPFFSYGGSSVVTIFAMLGLVSGAHARPESLSHERYIQPYR